MYASQKNIQIIISLLKQYGIKYMVLSPGTRNSALCHSVETDDDFICFSIVDERSAAYFALGLCESTGEPVCISCTSATATCNYLPAIREASSKNLPLVVLTGDREWYKLFQMEDQMIDQNFMFGKYCRHYCLLPKGSNDDEEWYCIRQVNESLTALKKGPVHINFQVSDITFKCKSLPVYRKITLHNNPDWDNIANRLIKYKRIFVLCGQSYPQSEKLSCLLDDFSKKYGAVISTDIFSNLNGERFLRTVLLTEAMSMTPHDFDNFCPDLVITFGGHFWSFIKYILRKKNRKIHHWHISENGEFKDGFRALTDVFPVTPYIFFDKVNLLDKTQKSNYFLMWKNALDHINYPTFEFSNFSVILDVFRAIPDNSLVHTSILNATRLPNYCDVRKKITAYSNLGTDGIDGCLSTWLGESASLGEDQKSFIIIGDLSFIYDMGGLLKGLNKNQRILVINNYAGGEFHILFSPLSVPELDLHIAAGHHTKMKDVMSVVSNIIYLSASNQDELEKAIPVFVGDSDKPILLEVSTDADVDACMLKLFYAKNQSLKYRLREIIKQKIKSYLIKRRKG